MLHLEYSTDHTEGMLCAMVVPGTRTLCAMVVPGTRTFMCNNCSRDLYFYVPTETHSLPININFFCSENTPLDRSGFERSTF